MAARIGVGMLKVVSIYYNVVEGKLGYFFIN